MDQRDAKWQKSEKDKYFTSSFTWGLQKQKYRQIKQKHIYIYKEQISDCQKRRGSKKRNGEGTNFSLENKYHTYGHLFWLES